MDKATRLRMAFDLALPDRPPILGGWLAAPEHIQMLTGCSEDDYWTHPFHWGVEAEQTLGSDGVVGIFQPIHRGEYRGMDEMVLEKRGSYTLDSVRVAIEALPAPDDLEDNFALVFTRLFPEIKELAIEVDEKAAYTRYLAGLRAGMDKCGDLVWCPADWHMIPMALWYHEFGYENALMLPALYPQHWRKLMRISAVRGRQRSILRARAIYEGVLPRAILTGEDLCSQRGPMISPDLLRQEYFPLLEYAIEPLLQAGASIVWHLDGDYRPLFDDVLSCGVAGFQGFQQECGMDIEWIVERRTRDGERLLIFGPLSVTTTLPYGTPGDVRAEVQRALHICRDRASLVFFTSNTITPDIPLENVIAFWEAVLESNWQA